MFKIRYLLFTFLIFINAVGFTEESEESIVLKVSDEAIASLKNQLPEEQFEFLENEIVGKEYATLDLLALLAKKPEPKPKLEQVPVSPIEVDSETESESESQPESDSAESVEKSSDAEQIEEPKFEQAEEAAETEEDKVYFTEEDIAKIQRSLDLYLERLNKIKAIAPWSYSLNDVNVKIQKLEDSIESLMKEEQETVRAEIEELKVQQKVYRGDFKILKILILINCRGC